MTRAEITDSRPTVRLTDSSSVNDALHGRKVAVIGLGYVGLPTALSLADQGAEIIGCDISESRLAEIKAGRVDLLECDPNSFNTPRARRLFQADDRTVCNVSRRSRRGVRPTPIEAHQTSDLPALSGACRTFVENATPGQTIVLTSTGPNRGHLLHA